MSDFRSTSFAFHIFDGITHSWSSHVAPHVPRAINTGLELAGFYLGRVPLASIEYTFFSPRQWTFGKITHSWNSDSFFLERLVIPTIAFTTLYATYRVSSWALGCCRRPVRPADITEPTRSVHNELIHSQDFAASASASNMQAAIQELRVVRDSSDYPSEDELERLLARIMLSIRELKSLPLEPENRAKALYLSQAAALCRAMLPGKKS